MRPPPANPMTNELLQTAPLTTEQIQKLLEENKQLIMMILEYHRLGKVAECAQYEDLLQKNLTYLAAFADAQARSQSQVVVSHMTPMQQAPQGHLTQQTQTMMTQQQKSNMLASKIPLQMKNPMQFIRPQLQQQQQQLPQLFPRYLGVRPDFHTPMNQLSPSELMNPPSSFRNNTGDPGSDNMHGKQFGSDR